MRKNIIIIAIAATFLTGCVSMKKYKALETKQQEFEFITQSEIQGMKNEKEANLLKIKELEANKAQLGLDMDDLKGKFEALQKDRLSILAKYDALLDQNKNVLNTVTSEKEELSNQLIKQKKELEQKERLLKSLEMDLKVKEKTLGETTATLSEREKKVAELQAVIDLQNKKVSELKAKLNNALKGFSANDLSVKEQNGKVYVSLSQNLLFATGSDKIDPKGVNAIKQLATVLAINPDIDILVEGHTDNAGTADLNWDLSTNRSLAVVKVLTTNKIDGKRITAAGRGMYIPVAPNTDAASKALNRRTDIILTPKLDELYKLLSE
jgi:chemotaxis protein MotB